MSSYSLFENPPWRAQDVGKPMPPDPHAISAAIPTWEQVIAYEEHTLTLPHGYPRFIYPKAYERLCDQFTKAGDVTRLFPSKRAAEGCVKFMDGEGQIVETTDGLYAVTLLGAAGGWLGDAMKPYWQHTGRIVSSRRAQDILDGSPAPEGAAAKAEIKARIAGLAGVDAKDVYLFPSGMAAIFEAHKLVTTRTPDARTIQVGFPYLDTLKVQSRFGGVKELPYESPEDLEALSEFLQKSRAAAVFCEAPGNPLLRTVDLPALKDRLAGSDVPLIVDDTIGTWENIDVRPYADITVTSLSKFFSGEGNVLAGALVLNPASPYYTELSQRLSDTYEDEFYAGDAIALENNSRDFSERMRIFNANALDVAQFLRKSHPGVKIYYPDETNRESYKKIMKAGGGFGGLLTIELSDPEQARIVYNALQCCKGPSLGTNFTLVMPYAMLAHYTELPRVAKFGVLPQQLRVSVGMEPLAITQERFDQALHFG